jgi:hypothetical protein
MSTKLNVSFAAAALALTAYTQAGEISGFGNPLTDPSLTGGVQQTFDSLGAGTYSSLTAGNVTYGGIGGDYTLGSDYIGRYNTTGTQSIYNPYGASGLYGYSFTFGTTVDAFGFNIGAQDDYWVLSDYTSNGGTLLESVVVAPDGASNSGNYVGLVDSGIGYVTYVDQGESSGDWIFIDNFTTSGSGNSVPDGASTLALLGSGLTAIGLLKRRLLGR